MKKIFTLILFIYVFSTLYSQQVLVLFSQTFDGDSSGLVFDSADVGTNRGPNNWAVNDSFSGHSIFPNTPPEDSVVSGQINANNAPYSNYLHILNVAADTGTGPANAIWNTDSLSDRFCYFSNTFCTLGLDTVVLSFYWICQGDTGAYGQFYFRANNGPWTQTGLSKYYNQSKWLYDSIQDTRFNNAENLQFGFRWRNNGGDSTSNTSFGIDDITATGRYSHPVKMSLTILSDTVCQSGYQGVSYHLSTALCEGMYQVELSDSEGDFDSAMIEGTFTVSSGDTSGIVNFTAPDSGVGNCFQVRVERLSPAPTFISDTSACFIIQACPITLVTADAPVLTDSDTCCVTSAIDVQFYSYGNVNFDNVYTAQLSDSTGSFANPTILGSLSSSQSFSYTTGDVPGLIPSGIPPGCGYYVRILCSSPASTGSAIGPYCLKRCDELTNDSTDLHFCIQSGPYKACDTLNIHIHTWNNLSSYDSCNNWKVEIRSMIDFSVVDSALVVYHDTTGGKFRLCMPLIDDTLPFAPGSYYMRVVSTCSTTPWDETGTVVRFTVGAPDTSAPMILPHDSLYCNAGVIELSLSPFNPSTTYQWLSSLLNYGYPFTTSFNPLLVQLQNNVQPGIYTITVREINFGCLGPLTSPDTISLSGVPQVHISGNQNVCTGDTAVYEMGFYPGTQYNWSVPAGIRILSQSSNQAIITFDDAGAYAISDLNVNTCGTDTGSFAVQVSRAQSLYQADTGCIGYTDTLQVAEPGTSFLWNTGDTSATIYFSPAQTGAVPFSVFISGNPNCLTRDSFTVLTMECTNGIKDISQTQNSLIIYPNPSSGQVFVEGGEGMLHTEVYDLNGELVWQAPGKQQMLNLSGLAQGSYIISVSTAEYIYKKMVVLMR